MNDSSKTDSVDNNIEDIINRAGFLSLAMRCGAEDECPEFVITKLYGALKVVFGLQT